VNQTSFFPFFAPSREIKIALQGATVERPGSREDREGKKGAMIEKSPDPCRPRLF
jgi:hypothetical protein